MHRVRDETEIYTNYLLSEFEQLNAVSNAYRGKAVDEDLIESIVMYLIFMYLNGFDATALMLRESADEPTAAEISKSVYADVGGKDVDDRLRELLGMTFEDAEGKLDDIIRSDGHRLYVLGQAALARAVSEKGIRLKKKWDTTMDGKERRTHHKLDGVEKDVGEVFETYLGNKAQAPGQFGVPEEDCNCRCILRYIKIS